MKKLLPAVLLCLFLCACSRAEPAWETVRDSLLTEVPTKSAKYMICFDVPIDAVLDEADGEKSVYRQKDGDYEIISRTIESCDLETVVQTLSGCSPEQVEILHTTRYGADECHFVWCSETERGMQLSRADAIFSQPYCYALTFSASEDCAPTYADTQAQVFGSFALFENEGF